MSAPFAGPGFAQALDGFRSLAGHRSLDAVLIAACDELRLLHDEQERVWRLKGRGAASARRKIDVARREALEARIARMAACTPAGKLARGELALSLMSYRGTAYDLPRAALIDFVQDLRLVEPMANAAEAQADAGLVQLLVEAEQLDDEAERAHRSTPSRQFDQEEWQKTDHLLRALELGVRERWLRAAAIPARTAEGRRAKAAASLLDCALLGGR